VFEIIEELHLPQELDSLFDMMASLIDEDGVKLVSRNWLAKVLRCNALPMMACFDMQSVQKIDVLQTSEGHTAPVRFRVSSTAAHFALLLLMSDLRLACLRIQEFF